MHQSFTIAKVFATDCPPSSIGNIFCLFVTNVLVN